MGITYKFKVAGLLLLGITFSCSEDYLQIEPFGAVGEATLSNEQGINMILIGAYSLLDGGGTVGGNYLSGIGRLRGGDEVMQGTETGPSIFNAMMYTEADGDIENKWRNLYSSVGRANDVLKMLPKVKDSTPDKLVQIEAEARFLRGVYYLYLAMFFKNVPWINESITYAERNYFVANTANIYPMIEADFTFAADNLTETKSQVGRANKWAAKSFLAKTLMFQNKFSQAKVILDDIITNGKTSNGLKYGLLPKYNDNFIAKTKNGKEAVFTVQMSVNDGTTSGNGNTLDQYNGTYGGPATCCFGWGQPTFDFVDAHQTDPNSGLPLIDTYQDNPLPNDNGIESNQPFTPYAGTLDSRLDWSVGRRGIPYRDWGVHPGKAWVRNQFNSGPYNVIKNIVEQARVAQDRGASGASNNPYNMIRFADVLLWAAECEAEVGSLSKAEEYVNIVRERAANPDGWVKTYINPSTPLAGFTNTPAANYKVGLYNGHFVANGQSYARKAIFFERRIELGLEHHRFFDMVRYDGRGFDLTGRMNWLMGSEGVRIKNSSNNWLAGKFIKNKHEYFPIPLGQIDLSKIDGASVLVQNPGW
jgi:starch-binding outer membrane protein, SusD/RagB family